MDLTKLNLFPVYKWCVIRRVIDIPHRRICIIIIYWLPSTTRVKMTAGDIKVRWELSCKRLFANLLRTYKLSCRFTFANKSQNGRDMAKRRVCSRYVLGKKMFPSIHKYIFILNGKSMFFTDHRNSKTNPIRIKIMISLWSSAFDYDSL